MTPCINSAARFARSRSHRGAFSRRLPKPDARHDKLPSAMTPDEITLESDVLVVGGGGAGMFAAVAAARNGARVLLLDKNVIGRGGPTIMAQMTCASAPGEAEP